MVNVTVKAAMRHGDLHAAIKKVGSVKALSERIGVPHDVIGKWYRYEACPPIKESLPRWPQSRIDALEKALFDVTGKLLEDLFPEVVRDKAFLHMSKTTEVTKEIEPEKLLFMARHVRGIGYSNPDTVEEGELKEAVRDSLGCLTNKQKLVIQMRFGIGCMPLQYTEIAQVLKITKQRVLQLERAALERLRSVNTAKKLVGHIA